ncbi:hypothetical protein B0H34DRAFT_800961 [Crassisporium funariophilum]|nr:hypothetical protein B0H34DRAFT_800961 [Crassisporium funariophilum]
MVFQAQHSVVVHLVKQGGAGHPKQHGSNLLLTTRQSHSGGVKHSVCHPGSSSGRSHNSKAPTFVFEYTAKRFINQEELLQETEATADARLEVFKVLQDNCIKATAHAASSYPYHGLSATAAPHTAPSVQSQGVHATVRETGRNYNDFFAAHEKHQQEMIKLEPAVDRQRRKSREQKPDVVNATIYEWEKTQLSGGLELYKRVKVNKKANKTVFHSYRSHQRLFNTFSNEWDLCEDFQFGIVDNK